MNFDLEKMYSTLIMEYTNMCTVPGRGKGWAVVTKTVKLLYEIFISYFAKLFYEFRKISKKRNFAIFDEISHFSRNFVLFQQISWIIFQDVSPVFQFNTYSWSIEMDMQHRVWHATWALTCSKEMDMVHGHRHSHGHGHTLWTWTCTMVMEMHNGQGHGLWTWDMHNGHGHGHAVWT